MGAYFEADYEWFSFFKYFEHFFCWPPAWELLWSWILMSSGVNTHCDPPSCTFSDPFSSNRVFQKFPPLGPTQRILHFLWKIKLCNLLLDPSEPTPPSLSLFIDSTALQWEKNSQADGLAQKNIKKVHSRYKELKRRNSNICSERYLMEIARLLSKPRAPSLASPSYQSTPLWLPSMCAYIAYTAICLQCLQCLHCNQYFNNQCVHPIVS